MMGQRRLDSSGACFHAEEALELLKSTHASVRTLIIHGLSGLLTLEDVATAAAADKDLGTVAARRRGLERDSKWEFPKIGDPNKVP